MARRIEKLTPAVNKNILIFLSGLVWVVVGTMLLAFSYAWLHEEPFRRAIWFAGPGVGAALVIHHLGFLKIVDKNLGRILPMEGKRCVFSFMTWKSYILVAVMVTMGILLRHSPIPKTHLSTLYIAMGLSLVLSSVRYLRVFFRQMAKPS